MTIYYHYSGVIPLGDGPERLDPAGLQNVREVHITWGQAWREPILRAEVTPEQDAVWFEFCSIGDLEHDPDYNTSYLAPAYTRLADGTLVLKELSLVTRPPWPGAESVDYLRKEERESTHVYYQPPTIREEE